MNINAHAVKAQSLTKNFAGLKAVNNVSINVPEGEIFGLIGPDGAGKTTLLRMLAGIMTPDSGEGFICGHSTIREQTEIKNKLAYMSQKFGLYQDLTVYENIKLYADLYGVKHSGLDKHIDNLLDFSYMRPFKDRRAGKLSGGMKQKLQLICALVHKPKVLLLDEPTNGVDPVSRRDFWRILYDLSADGVTIIVSTAYLDEAERCSEVALMNNGAIYAEGSPQDVIKDSNINILSIKTHTPKTDIAEIRTILPENDVHIFGDSIRVNALDREKTASLLKNKCDFIKSITNERPNLEDIFMSVQKYEDNTAHLLTLASEGIKKKTGSSVSTNSITKRFGSFTAVNSVSIDVKYGEIYGFLGPNGAGKSTTIKMLCGLLIPTEGEGSVAGCNINTETEKIKTNIGYMSQKFSLYEDLKIYENIDFYGGIYGLSGKQLTKRREWALELSGLTERKRELTANLTGGWRQRLALACAILHSPSIVFLDEPTSGADPASRRLFWDIIGSLASSGVTVFVSTHYMEEAEYCDRLALIFRGNMIAEGTPEKLKTEYMQDSIINVKVEKPQLYIKEISKLPGVNNTALFGARLHVRTSSPEIAGSNIKNYFHNNNLPFESNKIPPSMEDVFVSLIDSAEGTDE
ncbi:ABC transporter related protein [Denitrovibrio acetiphilus DSM 12809]|uniref:ABC transporter related protein n=1 Tax=Denitrovibrio acetiphilus (strain DSM 12809 / NBRC 114555 / N2460) TaxID=522772 RepID=D4H5G8_DENA2|nr:ATP-binding cassette domain-containing protein [Denitrovibrio acetiphilus]ADD67588.1 ABC transporter related protein [Denitrovibrio acetiphilus DSM 12809]